MVPNPGDPARSLNHRNFPRQRAVGRGTKKRNQDERRREADGRRWTDRARKPWVEAWEVGIARSLHGPVGLPPDPNHPVDILPSSQGEREEKKERNSSIGKFGAGVVVLGSGAGGGDLPPTLSAGPV